jgi:HAD superfamily hydrolase (TIGR01549 family)
MAVPAFPVYIFDLDGTLMDSAADICGTLRVVLATEGYNGDLSDPYLRSFIGRHLIDFFEAVGFQPDKFDSMVAHYRSLYHQRGHTATTVYPGVAEMLAGLGGRKSTATTKGSESTRSILEQFGLLPHFHHVQGTDGFPAKPEPDVILASIAGLGAQREECLFIGDSPQDMEAGRKAGVRTCAVRWGYGDLDAMARWEPDFWIDSPAELLKLR